ncbi:MAG: flagellar basal-body rod protein FlgG [Thermoleophilales bacterium]|nr:flagellar basal-body rod protein FlgG [Thermoleophilales bacterium]
MLEGLYSAAAGMAAQQQRMDNLANDVANVNTAGYKHVRTGFRDLVYGQQGRGAAATVTAGSGSAAQIIGRSFEQGALRETGQPLDVAIQGPGFLQVQTPQGQLALTRDGSLQVTNTGQLVTSTGAQLVPPINFPAGTNLNEVSVAQDGTITASGRRIGQLVAVDVPAPQALTSAGNNLFIANAQSGGPRNAAATTFAGGYLEASNVQLADAMVDMMDSQRAFELASKAIKQQDDMMGIANGIKR